MAVPIRKRKRPVDDDDDSEAGAEDDGAMRALFQRAFEAKFNPLERSEAILNEHDNEERAEESEEDSNSEWGGLSADDEVVETIRHVSSQRTAPSVQKHEQKAFMSSKPPTSNKETSVPLKEGADAAEDDASAAANLKHDLALQRLLKESHLLDPASFKGTQPTPDGKSRLKALDLRLEDLGAKESALKQQNMPLSHRRGIVSKATDRERKRRKNAAENGVILEKFKKTSKAPKFREKGMGGPAVGKFRGGTLKLSSRDLRSIQGDKQRRRK